MPEAGLDISTMVPTEYEYFVGWIARTVENYFKNPDVQRRFEEWQKNEGKEGRSCSRK